MVGDLEGVVSAQKYLLELMYPTLKNYSPKVGDYNKQNRYSAGKLRHYGSRKFPERSESEEGDQRSNENLTLPLNETKPDDDSVETETGSLVQPEMIIVEPVIWEFLEKFEEYTLRNICKTDGVYFNKQSLASDLLEISINAQSSTSGVKEAATEISSLYHSIYQSNVLETCHIPQYLDNNVVKQAKREVQGLFYNIIIKENPGGDNISIIGKREIAVDARRHLQHFFGPQRHTGFQKSKHKRSRRLAQDEFKQESRMGSTVGLKDKWMGKDTSGFGKCEATDVANVTITRERYERHKTETSDKKLDEEVPETKIHYLASAANSHASKTKSKRVPFASTDTRGVCIPPPTLGDMSADDFSNASQIPSSSAQHISKSNVLLFCLFQLFLLFLSTTFFNFSTHSRE